MLSVHPMYGYEIKKNFDRSIAYQWNANDGQIYPELKKMEKEALITSRIIQQKSKPNKKVYTLTLKGKRFLDEWLQTPTKEIFVKDEFRLKLFFFHRISPSKRIELLTQEKKVTEEVISYGKDVIKKYRQIELSSNPQALKWQIQVAVGTVREYETHLSWLEEMINVCKEELSQGVQYGDFNIELGKIFEDKEF